MTPTSADQPHTPAVSVLLPFRDGAATLGACLRSIAAQTWHDYEVVAIDDHSCDESAELVAQFARRDSRIRLLAASGRGLVSALNQGLAACRSDIVARMDSDDVMHPQRLAAQADAMHGQPDITVLGSRVRLLSDTLPQAGFSEYLRWQNHCISDADIADNIYVESPFAHPSVALRRQTVIAAGAYHEGDFAEDYELWLRLHRAGHRLAKLDRVLLEWRDHPQRLSRRDPRCARSAFDRLRAGFVSRDPRVRSAADRLWIWGAGRKTRRRVAQLLAHGFTPRGYVDIDPKKIGNRLAGVPVVAPDALDSAERPFVLSYVANHGARELIEQTLKDKGLIRGIDFLSVG